MAEWHVAIAALGSNRASSKYCTAVETVVVVVAVSARAAP